MKLLMFYAHRWWHKTALKGLAEVPDADEQQSIEGAAVVFFHSDADDMDKRGSVVMKFIKNTKWIAGKFGTKNIVLHSFNHLGPTKSPPEFAQGVLLEVEERLRAGGFMVIKTPFGYFNEFQIHVAGDSLAKVFKEF